MINKLKILILSILVLSACTNVTPDSSIKVTQNNNLINMYTGDQIELDNDLYVVNIWASWCLPCRDEHEYLLKLKNLNKINVIGINYKDKKSNAAKFLSDLGNPYHEVLIDLDGTKSIEFGAIGVPETYVINNNIIVKKYIGPLDQLKLKEIIEIIKNEKN